MISAADLASARAFLDAKGERFSVQPEFRAGPWYRDECIIATARALGWTAPVTAPLPPEVEALAVEHERTARITREGRSWLTLPESTRLALAAAHDRAARAIRGERLYTRAEVLAAMERVRAVCVPPRAWIPGVTAAVVRPDLAALLDNPETP